MNNNSREDGYGFYEAAELMVVEAAKMERHGNIRDTAGGESH